MKGFYFITDARLSRAGIFNDVKSAIAAGVKVVQYRNKSLSAKEAFKEALILRKLCRKITFLINDRVDLALAVGADGVHLGQDDLPFKVVRWLLGKNKIIGLTVHSLSQAQDAEKIGANYLGVSPIFSTKTKSDAGKPVGCTLIKSIKQRVSLPVIAIGGINLSNAREVIAAGADGLAVISAVVTKPDVKNEINKFQKFFS
ncbi:MAG: thiamine phosphate synthase [Candidatus Omnitrophica bacterium]|nr:thiamine phosphate synthase [Candidatus Omnitrophota bacterium]